MPRDAQPPDRQPSADEDERAAQAERTYFSQLSQGLPPRREWTIGRVEAVIGSIA